MKLRVQGHDDRGDPVVDPDEVIVELTDLDLRVRAIRATVDPSSELGHHQRQQEGK